MIAGRRSLWTAPALWKTPRPRFPQRVGRRKERAAHTAHKAFFLCMEKDKTKERLQ
jgi:hypothetical protein